MKLDRARIGDRVAATAAIAVAAAVTEAVVATAAVAGATGIATSAAAATTANQDGRGASCQLAPVLTGFRFYKSKAKMNWRCRASDSIFAFLFLFGVPPLGGGIGCQRSPPE